jgi:hypothetical protein
MSNEEEPFELTTQSIDDWERLTDLMREVRATRDKLKQNIILALADESGASLSGWIGLTRVRVVDTKGTVFSVTDLRDKYGDEWIEENSRKSGGAAIEIKTMAKHGPASGFEIPTPVE